MGTSPARSGRAIISSLEKLLIEAGGPDVTRMHSGRSRQDIGATRNRLFQRVQVLITFAALNNARATLLDFAAKYPDAIVPAYTCGRAGAADFVRSLHSRLCRSAGTQRRAVAPRLRERE